MTFRPGKTQSLAPDRRRSGLVVGLRRADTGEVIQLDTKPHRLMIGAAPSCDLPIVGDPYVSACHCVIERRDNGSVLVRDRDSRNGTFVDGAAIEGAELLIGSYLSVGRTTFVAVAGAGSGTRAPAIELLVGHDPALRRTVEMALKAAQSDCSVLILGETGTGKDLLARMIHERSRRANAPYVPVNCGGIPRELIASELFGHEKGAFTGATESRDGFFLEANNGTLFLDELGELPLDLQAHLLRALENRTVRRVGGTTERPINARIVAATNRLEGLGTDNARLRADLYHRIATLVLVLPPLRERMCDLAEIVNAQLAELAPIHGHKLILPEAWAALQRHTWPGNVRELRAAVGRAAMMGGDELRVEDFFPDTAMPFPLPLPHAYPQASPHGTHPQGSEPDGEHLQKLESVQREMMAKALERHGTIRAAAAALGIPKSTFADRARQWSIPVPGRRRIAGISRRRYIGVTPALPAQPPRPPVPAPGAAPLHLPDDVAARDPHAHVHEAAPMYLTESDHASEVGYDEAEARWGAALEQAMPGHAREAAPLPWPARTDAPPDETSMFELSSSDNVLDMFELSRIPSALHEGAPGGEAAPTDAAFTAANETTTPDEHPPVHVVQRDSRKAL